jgi:hypothetical protein
MQNGLAEDQHNEHEHLSSMAPANVSPSLYSCSTGETSQADNAEWVMD